MINEILSAYKNLRFYTPEEKYNKEESDIIMLRNGFGWTPDIFIAKADDDYLTKLSSFFEMRKIPIDEIEKFFCMVWKGEDDRSFRFRFFLPRYEGWEDSKKICEVSLRV